MKRPPKVAVVILNYNGISDTYEAVKSVLSTNYRNLQIIIIDNGSRVNEAKILKTRFKNKRINILRFRKNFGFTGGNNRSLSHISSKYILLLNSDARVEKNSLSRLVKQAEAHKTVGVLQPKILSLDNPKFFEYTGAAGGYIDSLGYPFARGRFIFHMEEDIGQYNDVVYLDWAGGSALFFRKTILKKVGGLFDEDFFAQQEEIDFCLRAKRAGYFIQFCPDAVVFHRGLISSPERLYRKIFWTHRNNLFVLVKHFSPQRLMWLLPVRVILDAGSMVFYLLSGQPRFSYEALRAYGSFVFFLPKTLRKRQIAKKRFPVYVDPLIHGGTIIFDYFIFGKRKYNQGLVKKKKQKRSLLSHSPYYGDIFKLGRIKRNILSFYKNFVGKIYST